ncbi:MAG: glycoside hydrolase family 2 protein [Clostridiales bacterium]|nr:glycoside hydrolase family 2 protein [Clostridiales bacterium]
MRRVTELKNDWIFVKNAEDTNAAAVAEGVSVSLPHTWNAVDGQDGGNDYYRGTCWYRRVLEKPELKAGEKAYLEFDGAAMTAEVYLNGEKLTHHEGGYSRFRIDITEKLEKPENELIVSVDNSDNDHVYPQKADFTFYGGLYRMVRLIIVPESHFSVDYYGGSGIKVTPVITLPEKEGESASAVVTVEIWTDGNPNSVKLTVAGETKQEAVIEGYAKAEFNLDPVHLWDGVNDPYLYTAKAELESGDEVEVRFGCRNCHVDSQKGFFLNGRSYPLRGVSRHQDRAGAGNALTFAMHQEDMEIIKEIGANTLRLAHYQHAQEFYDMCDENGIIVWAEIPYITLHMPNGRENTLSQMQELVVQNYNHPSIVCWGLSNEITAAGIVSDDLLENHRLLNELCHKLDQSRFTTMADVFMLETDSPILEIPDVNSYNLYFGWYLGELEQNEEFFDEYHAKYPERAIGFSEYGADANPQYQCAAPEKGDYTESYQTVYHEHILEMIEKRPWLWATHVWNMFDFAADGRDEGGKNGQNQKGLVTFDRKLKKDTFYLYKAYWNRKEPFVHIAGGRYIDRTEDVTEVKIYTNQPEVELLVDSKSFATQTGNKIFRFNVPITGEHTLLAKAGECTSSIIIRKVDTPNPDYMYKQTTPVINWFDQGELDESCYSVYDKMEDIRKNPEAAKVIDAMMAKGASSHGDVADAVKDNPNLQRMMGRMTMISLLKQGGADEESVRALNRTLQQFKKV